MKDFFRFYGNDLLFYAAQGCLFAGLWLKFDLGTALVVVGAVISFVSVVSAFFVTALSSRFGQKGKS